MKRFAALLLSGLILLLSGCGAAKLEGTAVQFYYAVSGDQMSGPAIGFETKQVEALTVDEVMRRLLEGPYDESGLNRTFPEGTALLGWSLEEGALKLNLSESFGRLSGISMTTAEYCIVLTVAQVEGVETVTITAGGQTLPGAASAAMSVEDAILKGETDDPITVGSQLYFPLEDGSGLGVEYREFEVGTMELLDQANAVLDQLVQGPGEASMAQFLYGAGKLQATSVRGQVCTVDLDDLTLECICASEKTFDLYLYAVVDSLVELEGIGAVAFQLNGMPVDGWDSEYAAVYEF